MASNKKNLRVCLLQFESQENVAKTLIHLEELVEKAVNDYHPELIVLPECFAHPYITERSFLETVAEPIDGKTCSTLSALSKKFGTFIVGGSVVERDGDKLYNTATVWNNNGELIARHRKVHLAIYHGDDGTELDETKVFAAGDNMTTFDVNGVKCGVAICYDACFEEFIKMYGLNGCDLVLVPAAYNVGIGLRYWEIFHRSRAIDNQLFVAPISGSRNEEHSYVLYGHSMIIDPLGKILCEAGTAEEIIYQEIDLKLKEKVRKECPIYTSRRPEVYYKSKH